MKRLFSFVIAVCILVSCLSFGTEGALYFFSAVEHYLPGGRALAVSDKFEFSEMRSGGGDVWIYFNMAFIPEGEDTRFTLYLDEFHDNEICIKRDALVVDTRERHEAMYMKFGTGLDNFNNVVIRILSAQNGYELAIFLNEEMVYIGIVPDAALICDFFAGRVEGTAVIEDYHLYRNDSTYTEIPTDFEKLVENDPYLPGDADGDGVLSASDAIRLRRALAGHPESIALGGDMNSDGRISSKDLLLVRRSLAK